MSFDGLTLYFSSLRSGGAGGDDLWSSTRASTSVPFGAPVNLAEINSADSESGPASSGDGLTLFFASDRDGDLNLWMASRESVDDAFGAPVPVDNVNSNDVDKDPAISWDGTELIFVSHRTGDDQLWRATRTCLD